MSVLCETINTNNMIRDVKTISIDEVCHRYFSNLLTIIVLMRMNLPVTAILNKDQTGWRLNKMQQSMSIVNFYGTLIFSNDPDKFLGSEVARELKARVKLLFKNDVLNLHKMVSGEISPEWNFINHMLALITVRLQIDSMRAKKIRAGLMIWNDIDDNQKQLVLNNCYYYISQFDVKSPFLSRLRSLMTYKLIEPVMQVKDKFVAGIGKLTSLIKEDEGAAVDATTPSFNNGSTSNVSNPPDGKTGSADIAVPEFRLFNNKIIRRMKKRFKTIKFKAPNDKYRGKRDAKKIQRVKELN